MEAIEPQTHGRVVLETTCGALVIDLFARETPMACRNFVQLGLEGYYDGLAFHRVVKDFLVQTGDRTGTGYGGECVYGDERGFAQEIHPRLRFHRRGQVAYAHAGGDDDDDHHAPMNLSQFFITLDKAMELQGKYTLFGRVAPESDTIFNVVKIGESQVDEDERPLYPPKILGFRVDDNPFPGLEPRITPEERKAQERAKVEARKEEEMRRRRGRGKKDKKLLSFGSEVEEPLIKGKIVSSHDALDDPRLLKVNLVVAQRDGPPPAKATEMAPMIQSGPQTSNGHAPRSPPTTMPNSSLESAKSSSVASQIKALEADLKAKDIAAQEPAAPATKTVRTKKRSKRDDEELMRLLSTFRGKVQKSAVADSDDDADWKTGSLRFERDPEAEAREAAQGELDYEVIDPVKKSREIESAQRERRGRGRHQGSRR